MTTNMALESVMLMNTLKSKHSSNHISFVSTPWPHKMIKHMATYLNDFAHGRIGNENLFVYFQNDHSIIRTSDKVKHHFVGKPIVICNKTQTEWQLIFLFG